MQVGEKYCGFTVQRVRQSEELNGTMIEMIHDKTGAELCWVDNGLENKVFAIAFKTLPEDDTGVFHILEHSVLCGSEKYPVKDPFVELLKSSLNTFLNAMTFSDKTMYPLSSRNKQDFLNLTEVYLDAVFAPAILQNPNIFYQEGWHLEQENGKLTYKGVVFNEMKGALSDVQDLSERKLSAALYPDNCYGFESGGDPVSIPQLTYEQFVDTYHRFYHPSNARVFLDGAVPLEETLTLLDVYFSRFEKKEICLDIPEQRPVSSETSFDYELPQDEDLENKGRLLMGKIVGNWHERTKGLALQVLFDVLAGTNDSPLKQPLLESGLVEDMNVSLTDGIAQLSSEVEFENIQDGETEALLALYRETLQKIAAEGVDHAALHASINMLAFRVLEPKEPQGLIRCINSFDAWLYGGDPLEALEYNKNIAELREMVDRGAFDDLLREVLLDETGMAILHGNPSHTVGDEKRQEEEARLAKIAAGWQQQDWEANQRLNETLSAWQKTPDDPEKLARLPLLSLDEVSDQPFYVDSQEHEVAGVRVLTHPVASPGLVHFCAYFQLADFTKEELTALGNISLLLTNLPTAHHDALSLQQALKRDIGRMVFTVEAQPCGKNRELCVPTLTVHCSVLKENLPIALDMAREILLESDFNQPERIRAILVQANEEAKALAVEMGVKLAQIGIQSHFSAVAAAAEALGGSTLHRWLHEIVKHFDEQKDELIHLFQRVQQTAFCSSRMMVGMIGAEPEEFRPLIESLPVGTKAPWGTAYTSELPEKIGGRIPAQVGYAGAGSHLSRCTVPFAGSMEVAAKILSLNYLWNVIRVQGGAYGTGIAVQRTGNLFYYSYRDPTPGETLKKFADMENYLRSFCDEDWELDKYIIATVADKEPLLTPRQLAEAADTLWFSGLSREEAVKFRHQILHTSKQDLLRFCDALHELQQHTDVFVVAPDAMLKLIDGLDVIDL